MGKTKDPVIIGTYHDPYVLLFTLKIPRVSFSFSYNTLFPYLPN